MNSAYNTLKRVKNGWLEKLTFPDSLSGQFCILIPEFEY